MPPSPPPPPPPPPGPALILMLLAVTLCNQIVHNACDAALMLQMQAAKDSGRAPTTLRETWPMFKGGWVCCCVGLGYVQGWVGACIHSCRGRVGSSISIPSHHHPVRAGRSIHPSITQPIPPSLPPFTATPSRRVGVRSQSIHHPIIPPRHPPSLHGTNNKQACGSQSINPPTPPTIPSRQACGSPCWA